LTEEELKVEHTRILRGDNPHAPDNIVRFSFKESEYKAIAQVEQLAMHFKMDGNMIHEDSDEARRQRARENVRSRKPMASSTATTTTETGPENGEAETTENGTDAPDEGVEGEEGQDGEEVAPAEEAEEDEPVVVTGGPPKKLRNQFNFSERASQTFNYTTKERGVSTVPPPRSNFSAVATQGIIFDSYKAEESRKAALKKTHHDDDKSRSATSFEPTRAAAATDSEPSIWAAAAKVVTLPEVKKVERMVLQNVFDEVLLDFKYYENGADQYKTVTEEGGSSVLPLWKFSTPEYVPAVDHLRLSPSCRCHSHPHWLPRSHLTWANFTVSRYKRHSVTCVAFIPGSSDLIVVGFGSYDYLKQGSGAVACFSFKDPVSGARLSMHEFSPVAGVRTRCARHVTSY
jgi:dynein intermediate chain 1